MNDFNLYMKKREIIAGWIYLPIHSVLMSLFILPELYKLLAKNGIILDTVQVNTIYYLIGFAFVFIFMMSFLRENFVQKPKANMLLTVGKAYLITIGLNYIVTIILAVFTNQLVNPNSEAVNEAVSINVYSMLAVAALLTPVVEEVLFRGIVFGTIRTKSKVLAYIVSILLFSIYHLWSSIAATGDWTILIYMLQYVPAGFALAWAYEKSGSIWTSIFLHMIINAVAILAQSAIG